MNLSSHFIKAPWADLERAIAPMSKHKRIPVVVNPADKKATYPAKRIRDHFHLPTKRL